MKKSIFILLIPLVTLVAVSCKKDPADIPIGTLSATIDGTAITFNVSAKASAVPVQNGYGIKIFGYKKDPGISGTDLQLVIVRPSPVSSGTYTENIAGNPLVQMSYFYDFLLGVGISYSNHHSISNPATINITAISAVSVKGTFEGELEGVDLNGKTTKVQVTNGVFYLSF